MTILAKAFALYRKKPLAVLLGGVLAFYLVNNLIWLLRDTLPPAWDQAAHADHCLTYFRLLGAPMELSLTKLLTVSSYYPPFFYACTLPASLLFGFSCDALAATNLLFLLILGFSVFKIGEHFFSRAVGAGAVIITALFPMVYGLSREVLLDFSLLAMVALAQYVILASGAGTDPKQSWLLGLVIGLTVLTKWTAVAFLPFTFLLVLWNGLKEKKRPARTVFLSLGIAVLVFLAVALPWYLKNASEFSKSASSALYKDSVLQGDPSGFLKSALFYWKSLRDVNVSKVLGIFILAGSAAFVLRVRNGKALAFLMTWALPAFLVFVLVPNKDGRNIVPLLPALAILTAAGMNALRPLILKKSAWGLLVLAALFQFYATSFGWPLGMSHPFSHPPSQDDWKVQNILTVLGDKRRDASYSVAVLPDMKFFNAGTFRFTSHLMRLPFHIDPMGDGPVTFEKAANYDVIISKSGRIAARHTMAYRKSFRRDYRRALAEKDRGKFPFRLWKAFRLPDRSRAIVYVQTKE